MTWFAFHGYGTIDEAGVQEKQLVAAGFHGYATKAQAEANPNSANLLQKLLVNAAEADYQAALKTQAQPGAQNPSTPDPQIISRAPQNVPALAALAPFC